MATGRTWAQVARKKTPPALPTECAVNLEQYAAPLHLPPSSSRHSAFVLLPFNFENNWMLDMLASLPASTVGVVPRQDISLVEVCFANKEAQQDFLSSSFTTTHFTVQPLPPAGTPPQYVPIKFLSRCGCCATGLIIHYASLHVRCCGCRSSDLRPTHLRIH